MFTLSIAGVARSGCIHTSNPAPARRVYQLAISSRPSRQRRYSSSKASIPPNGGSRTRSSANPSEQTTSSTGRRGRKPKAPSVESGFAHLPSVPFTHHLHPADINVSSFFSLHRPISVTKAIPPPATSAVFASIFEPRLTSPRHHPSTVIHSLRSAVDVLEGNSQQDSMAEDNWMDTQNAEQMIESSRPYARANIPKDVSTANMLQDLRPFSPPPIPETSQKQVRSSRRATRSKPGASRPKQWKATIILTEYTTPSGQKAFVASGTPLERVSTPTSAPLQSVVIEEPESATTPQAPLQQPILHRMRLRRMIRPSLQAPMMAISVKRQRKLKMKKKKYKKLMKRTRNVRRKLGKL